MHMFCPAWSIVSPCGRSRRSLICVYWIVLFVVQNDCVRVSPVVRGTKKKG